MSIITRAALAGVAAGLLAAVFFLTVSKATLDEAVDVEEQLSEISAPDSEVTTSSPDTDEGGVEISRNTQAFGAVVAMLMYGFLVGVVFGTVFVAVRHRLLATTDFGRAIQLAMVGFVTTVVLPALKYPANPPGIGNSDDVNQRTVVFLTLIGAGIAASIGLGKLYPWLVDRLKRVSATTVVSLLAVTSAVVLLLAWPDDSSVIPADYPADLLWRFRVQSLATQAITWAGLGLFTGWLLSRPGQSLLAKSDD